MAKPISESANQLPRPIVAKLRALSRRARLVALFKGLCTTLAVAVLCLLAIMVIDSSFTLFSERFRAFLTGSALVAVAVCAVTQIWRPLRRRLSLVEVARAVEQRHPEIEERLSSAVELLDSGGEDDSQVSEQMLATLVKDATVEAGSVRTGREFSFAKAKKPLLAALLATALVGGAYAVWPKHTSTLLTRAISPLQPVGNAYAEEMTISPGDQEIAAGDSLTVEVELDGTAPEIASVRRKISGASDAVERMAFIEPISKGERPRFRLTIPSVSESFSYRVHCGRALSQYYDVIVKPRPRVATYQVEYNFPSYTGREPLKQELQDLEIAALSGTTTRLTATLDRPVKTATLLLDGAPIWDNTQSLDADGRPQVTWEFVLLDGTDGNWSVQLENSEGVTNRAIESPLRAIEDAAPTVTITTPLVTDLLVKPNDVVPLAYVATEDYGFLEAQIIVSIAGREQPPIGIALPERGSDRWNGEATLNLGSLNFVDQDRAEVRVRLADNRPGNGAEAFSETLTVYLNHEATSLLEQMLAQQQAELQGNMWEAMEKLMEARALAENAPATLVDAETIPADIAKQLQSAAELAGQAEGILRDTAEAAAGTAFENLAPKLEQLAQQHIEAARSAAEAVPMNDRVAGRVHMASTSVRELEEGIAELSDVMRDLKEQADRAQLAAQLGDIQSRREELAEALAEKSDPEERAEAEKELSALDKLTNELVKRSAESLAKQFENAGGLAEELAKRAAEIAQDEDKMKALLSLAEKLSSREELIGDLVKQLAEEQRDVAKNLADLATSKSASPELKKALEEVSKLGMETAAALSENRLADAAKLAAAADAALPESIQPSSARARMKLERLTAAQRGLSQQMGSLRSGDLESTLGGMEEGLAKLVEQLAGDTDALQELLQTLADPETAAAVKQAAEQMAKAGGQPDASNRAEWEAAAEALAKAAEELALNAEAPAAQRPPTALQPGIATQERDDLAQRLAELSTATSPAELGPNWARIGGDISKGLNAVDQSQTPTEYRDMVKRYFEEIARRSKEGSSR